jgi:hypothetical protein
MPSVPALGDYSLRAVVPADLPWPVRVRLRSARKKGRTGLILYAIIRQLQHAQVQCVRRAGEHGSFIPLASRNRRLLDTLTRRLGEPLGLGQTPSTTTRGS